MKSDSAPRRRAVVLSAAIAVAAALACAPLLAPCGCAPESSRNLAASLHDGDIIFQTSRSSQSALIRKATGSEYTHVGLVFIRHGTPEVLEAVGPVKYTPLAEWIDHGEGGRVTVMRLCDAERLLTAEVVARLRRAAEACLGRPYDRLFLWSDDALYCSELVWKSYRQATGLELGRLTRLGDWIEDPAARRELARRHGGRIPLDAPVIAPVDIAKAEGLCEVGRR